MFAIHYKGEWQGYSKGGDLRLGLEMLEVEVPTVTPVRGFCRYNTHSKRWAR